PQRAIPPATQPTLNIAIHRAQKLLPLTRDTLFWVGQCWAVWLRKEGLRCHPICLGNGDTSTDESRQSQQLAPSSAPLRYRHSPRILLKRKPNTGLAALIRM